MKRLGSTLILAILAAAFAAAGAWLVNKYVTTEKARATARAKTEVQGTLTNAVFTKAEVPANTQLKADMFVVKQTPKKFMPKDAILDIKELDGLYAKMPLVADELVRAAKVGGREQLDSLAFRIPKGKRAVSINTSPAKAVAFAINPGDHVDVIALIPTGNGSDKLGKTVLQDVEVIEISTGKQPEGKEGSVRPNQAPTATLALYPSEAEIVALAETSAELMLALRGTDDREAGASRGVTLGQIMGMSSTGASDGSTGINIEVFYGDKKSNYTVPGQQTVTGSSPGMMPGGDAPEPTKEKMPGARAKVEVIYGDKTVTTPEISRPETSVPVEPATEERPPQFESTLPRRAQ